ncbi:unnamed protein product [Porites evermanni]|uniref:Uncharacterized protein n=1 Tax=Porites evermanni TaxID=104178 RepID=A0ABN8RX35_9CNID|nr:unnamed protein product [Porites evermanni]
MTIYGVAKVNNLTQIQRIFLTFTQVEGLFVVWEEMEILNIIIAAITAATFNSVAHSAPVYNTPSTLELLVTAVIPSRVTNASLEAWNDKLPIAYKQLTVFRSPLYLAFSYEENQRPLHSILADALWDTSVFVNATTAMLIREMRERAISVPPVTSEISESNLNRYVRDFLQGLVDDSIVNLSINDDLVKIYRNYVILYSLSSVIEEASICVSGI